MAYAANLDTNWEKEEGWFNPEVLFRLWRILVRRRRLIAAVVGLALVLGLVVTLIMPSIYRATITLQLARESAKIVNVENVQSDNDGATNREFLETQYALLKSRSLAEKVVQALNLDTDEEFSGKPQKVGFFSWIGGLIFGVPEEEPLSANEITERRIQAAERLQGMMAVTPQRNSQLVDVHVNSASPELASKIANALGESFIAANLERRYDASSYARNFLEDRLAELKLKLEETEKELVNYAQSASIVNTDDNKTLLGSNLESLNDAISKVQTERIKNEELWKQAQGTGGFGLPQILENDTIRDLRTQYARLSAEYQQKLKQFKPAFPQMMQLKAQLDELELQMTAQADLVRSVIQARYEATMQQENMLKERLEALKTDVLAMRDRSIRYNILKREVDTNKTLYEGLLQRYKEIGIAGGIGASNISIIDRAEVPKVRYSPRLKLNLAIAAFLGLMAGVAAAFGLEMFDDTLKSPDQAEEKIGIPVVGVIPLAPGNPDLMSVLDDPRSNVSEAYRSLRTALQFSASSGTPKSLLVTSSQPGEGKSTTAVALARNFSQLGFRVLLIDADLRRPSLHKYFDVENAVGISDYLEGSAQLVGILHTPRQNLTFIPCGSVPQEPTELLAGSKMKNLLTYGSKHFDMLILDGPPILELADAPLLASMTEGTLMVVSANHVRHAVVRTRLKRLQQARGRLAGLVLTKFDMREANSYYYYTGYYSSAYEYASDKDDRLEVDAEAPALEMDDGVDDSAVAHRRRVDESDVQGDDDEQDMSRGRA
ncbi:GumC family protein [Ancylobacter terrae]|uniref:GumC family protein n=1 Tax=Ancylobacter sp. sgz301288 TaxID=3342077 RepID=UPI00385E9046